MVDITVLADKNCLFSGINFLHETFMMANSWWRILNQKQNKKLFQMEIVTVDGKSVRGGAGMVVTPQKSIDDVENTDLVLIPPYLPSIRWLVAEMDDVTDWIKRQYESGVTIGALCTGTFLLARTGLLDDKIATTNWRFARSFQKQFPRVLLELDRVVTEQDGLICSGASFAYMDLVLRIIEKFGSVELAAKCSKTLLLDSNRQSQAPYVIFEYSRNHNDEKVIQAQKWLEDHFSSPISIDDLAKKFGISPRHFQRRFKEATGEPPLSYLRKIRVEIAKEKLETTSDSFGEITWNVGYEDVNSFRKLFVKHTGLTPHVYRMRFSRPIHSH